MKALDRLRKKVEIATNGYEENLRREWYDLLDTLEEEMTKEVHSGFPHVQVSIDEAKVKLLEHEPVTILSVFAFPDNEAPRLALLTGQAVAITSAGKKVAARVIDVKLVGDKKKENVVHGRASLFAPGDFSALVGLLVILKPLQGTFDYKGEVEVTGRTARTADKALKASKKKAATK